MHILEILGKLLVAALAGGLIGWEREQQERPAGLRTHVLLCLGSALFTVISMELAGPRSDPTRIAAQIVSGIGFLGAGTIFRSGVAVRGLTTATGLWAVAAIGMGIGFGGALVVVSVIAAFGIYAINHWVRLLENQIIRTYRDVTIHTSRRSGALARVFQGLDERGVEVERLRWLSEENSAGTAALELRLRLPAALELHSLRTWLASQHGVEQIDWD